MRHVAPAVPGTAPRLSRDWTPFNVVGSVHAQNALEIAAATMNTAAARRRSIPRHDVPLAAKRTALRKGTHSCWECKRRKMKCVVDVFAKPPVCRGCLRRGSACVGQEYPEELAAPQDTSLVIIDAGRNFFAAEAKRAQDTTGRPHAASIASQWTNNRPTSPSATSPDVSLNPSSSQEASDSSPLASTDVLSGPGTHATESVNCASPVPLHTASRKYEQLSQYLHALLPSPQDTEKICRAGPRSDVLAHEIMTMPYTTLVERVHERHEIILDIPDSTQHPVLLARHMLRLASFLQNLDINLHPDVRGLSDTTQAMADRLLHTVSTFVTSNNDFIDSIEALECIIIQCVYLANAGRLQESWVAGRRAVTVAQLMGLNRSHGGAHYKAINAETKYHPELMWFRIVYLDRLLSSLLGLPQGCADRSMASDAMLSADAPLERLERIHYVVASWILERNDCNWTRQDPDFPQVPDLDRELQKAATSLPSKWWLAPQLNKGSTSPRDFFWNTRRLFAQVLHYSLLNQLHLPNLLRSSSPESGHEYSRNTCVNASRDVLSRCIAQRHFIGHANTCFVIEFLSMMACITLLLAHLDSPQSENNNSLAHQYHSDRAMIELMQEHLRKTPRLASDPVSVRSADLLQRLLAIDVGTEPSNSHQVNVYAINSAPVRHAGDNDVEVSGCIPYFGIIEIARAAPRISASSQGAQMRSTKVPEAFDPQTSDSSPSRSIERLSSIPSTVLVPSPTAPASFDLQSRTRALNHECSEALDASAGRNSNVPDMSRAVHHHLSLADPLLQDLGTHAAAGVDEWVFQEEDPAFFDNLLRGSQPGAGHMMDWTAAAGLALNE